ncbi:MAG: glutamyl-tRNA reductase [Planctomycetaceae bacterium]|nr:glutamyl-tRNA reductase [Planctomycetaceae bacterium]
MNFQVLYCNHESAKLNVRERLAFSVGEQLSRAYNQLRDRFPAAEVVVLSTCNRVEVYTAQQAEDTPSRQQLVEFFSEFHEIPREEFAEELLEHTGPNAVKHLFRVASSLDSMVLGEPQIVSQVKEAYWLAQEADACGPLTHGLFQGAIRVSSRVRHETRLAEGRVSIASVAVGEFGKSIFDRFDDKTVLIIGAGEMGEETLRYLQDEGVGKILVANRNPDRAECLAADFENAEPRPYEQLDDLMSSADVIVSTTGADQPIVNAARFQQVRRSNDRPVFILDLGAPRDFAVDVVEVDDNVFLYDIDDLQNTCARNRNARRKEIDKAIGIIDDETNRFMRDIYHRATGPIVKRLREQWHDISAEEVDRLRSRLSHLTDKDFEAVERSVERIVNKLLHPPLEALKDEARDGTPHGLMDALRRLFHIRE